MAIKRLRSRARILVGVALFAAMAGCNALLGIDDADVGGAGQGAGGVGGSTADAGGSSVMGMGGAAGSGKGGAAGAAGGGAPSCTSDVGCVGDRGAGSLCVAGTCTKATGACDASLLAVVDPSRDASAAPLFADGCHYRSLDEALAVSLAGSAKRIAVFADVAVSNRDVLVTDGVSFEGYGPSAAEPVDLKVNAPAGQALITLEATASLRGFALDVEGGSSVLTAIITLGGGSLAGPLRVRGAGTGLEVRSVTGTNQPANVIGTASAPVTFSDNTRAVVLNGGGGLTLKGDGAAGGLVIENSKLEGVVANSSNLVLDGVVVRGQTSNAGVLAAGPNVTIKNSVFVQNKTSVFLAGDPVSGTSFEGTILADNDFTDAVLPGPTGSVICGDSVITGTALHLPGQNLFPGGRLCGSVLKGTCAGGVDIGAYDANTFNVLCE